MNRKKDLELLSEVYAEAMGYAGGRGSVNTQPGAGGTGDYDDSTGQITQRAEDQNPLENDEGDLDDDLDKIANELGTTRDKLDLEEIISILKIRENLSNQDKVKVAIGVQNALRKELKNLK